MGTNKLRQEFRKIFKIDAVFTHRNSNDPAYAFDYVHWIEDKLLAEWQKVEDKLPNDEIPVLCYHIDSGNYFICYRTTDCLTHEPKWQGGAMPTHWKYLDKPLNP